MDTVDLKVLQAIWPEHNFHHLHYYEQLNSYIEHELRLLETQVAAFASVKRISIITVISLLRERTNESKADLIQEVTETTELNCPSNNVAELMIELAVRIWLTINVDTFDLALASHANPPSTPTIWNPQNVALGILLEQKFSPPTPKAKFVDQMIPSGLTMPGLAGKSKVYIRWTNNLLDHLSITEEKGKYEIVFYEHLLCLLNHREYPDKCAIPPSIIQEAIDTFTLLLPTTAVEKNTTKRFLQKRRKDLFKLCLDRLDKNRKLDLRDYPYWGKSIKKMMVIMERPRRGWRQGLLDNDGQNFEQVISIWAGVLATVLTVVALVFGIISTVLAFKANQLAIEANKLARESLTIGREANELARRSFELDLRQACLGSSNATDSLEGFCT